MRFPLPLTAKIAGYVIGHKLRGTKKFATVLARAAAHVQSHMHGLWADSRVFHVAQGHDELGGLSWGGKGMQRPDGFDLRRRTAYLSAYRGAGSGTAHAGADCLHLHERHVYAQEDARVDRLAVVHSAGICRRKNHGVARWGIVKRKRRS